MAYYIKARPYVARQLGLEGLCGKTADKCVLLWQADLGKTGYRVMADAVAAIGGVLLTPQQAKMETDGILAIPLPWPTDKRYVDPEEAEPTAEKAEPTEEQKAEPTEEEPMEEAEE